MIVLDSDHLSILRFRTGERTIRLAGRIALSTDPQIGTTIANVEETMRCWLATLAKERDVERQISAYRELAELFKFFGKYYIALFDTSAAQQFSALRASKIRIGTMDLKTASITLANNALLLTANTQDFEKIPGLRFENWIS